MLFSSIPFLYYFLPLVLLIYFAVPKVLKNAVLLISSLAFYGWGEPRYVFLMIATVGVNYILGLLIEKFRGKALSKVFVVTSVVSALAILGYFKYADFFIENFNAITGLSVGFLNIALPIGISFYTFQILSYTVDVYRDDIKPEKNFLQYALFVSFFPQLVAGPIERSGNLLSQIQGIAKISLWNFERMRDGLLLMFEKTSRIESVDEMNMREMREAFIDLGGLDTFSDYIHEDYREQADILYHKFLEPPEEEEDWE